MAMRITRFVGILHRLGGALFSSVILQVQKMALSQARKNALESTNAHILGANSVRGRDSRWNEAKTPSLNLQM